MAGDKIPTGAISSSPGGPLVRSTNRIKENRACRDVFFLLLFIVFWVGMVACAIIGLTSGNPARLIYGLDYKGNLCNDGNASPPLKGYDTRYWLNPNQLYDSGNPANAFVLRNARSICLTDCPTPGRNGTLSWVCDYPENSNLTLLMSAWASRKYDYYDLLTPEQKNYSALLKGPCYPVLFETAELFWSCQLGSIHNASYQQWLAPPINGVKIENGSFIQKAIEKALNKPARVLERYVADLGRSWRVLIVCAAVAPLVLSFFWLIIIRLFTGIIAWLTVALINLLFIVVTAWFYVKSGWVGQHAVDSYVGDEVQDTLLLGTVSKDSQTHLKVVAVIMTVITVVLVIVTLAMLRRIMIAIAVLKVGAKAIGSIPALVFFPFVPFIVAAIFIIYWVAIALYIFSSGQVKQNECKLTDCCYYNIATGQYQCGLGNCCGFDTVWNNSTKWVLLYHIFGYFWTMQFIIACTHTTIAGAIASYYWAQGDTRAMPMLPILSSIKRLAFYSLGSMALGSLIVAIIQMVRFILEYIRRRLKAAQAADGGTISNIINAACCCLQCCLGCLEYVVKFINRNAYIMIAITGDGFCASAGRAATLIINNVLRVVAVNVVGDMMLFLGKLCISISCALFAFLMLDTREYRRGKLKISSPLFPVLFCFLSAYIVAAIFFSVVEMAVDTILLAFCEDCEENRGTPMYAPPLLLEALGKSKAIDERAEERKLRRREKRAAQQ